MHFQRTASLTLLAAVFLNATVALAQQSSDNAPDSSQYIFVESAEPPPASFLKFTEVLHDYYTSLANNSDQSLVALNTIGKLYPANTRIDVNALNHCLKSALHTTSMNFKNTSDGYENSFVITDVNVIAESISLVQYSHSHIALQTGTQHSELNGLYISQDRVLGYHPEITTPSAQCWNDFTELPAGSPIPADSKTAFQDTGDNQTQPESTKQSDEPIISTGQNKWDLITNSDPSLFECLVYKGRVREEIFDKRIDSLVIHKDVYQYIAYYKDGTSLVIRAHPEYETEKLASDHALTIASKVGQLPALLRANIQRIAIMRGDKTAMGDGGGEGIHLQTGNTALREKHNRLEETLFHEAVHTSADDVYGLSKGWLEAQKKDRLFLTEYGRRIPGREDLAETLLYVYALIYHPTRIPENYRDIIAQRIPNRIAYIKEAIFNTDIPLGVPVERSNECDNS